MKNVSPLITSMINAATQAAAEAIRLRSEGALDTQTKADKSLVTAADKAAEKIIREKLQVVMPEAKFLGEESADLEEWNKSGKKGYYWVVDPIDGTAAFKDGEPWAVSIGLQHDGHTIASVVMELNATNDLSKNEMQGQLFFAEKGEGAFRMRVPSGNSEPVPLQEARKLTSGAKTYEVGFSLPDQPNGVYDGQARKGDMAAALQTATVFHGVARHHDLRSACCGMMMLADGRAAAYTHDYHFPWDVAASKLILDESCIPFMEKETALPNVTSLVAASKRSLFSALVDIHNSHAEHPIVDFSMRLPMQDSPLIAR